VRRIHLHALFTRTGRPGHDCRVETRRPHHLVWAALPAFASPVATSSAARTGLATALPFLSTRGPGTEIPWLAMSEQAPPLARPPHMARRCALPPTGRPPLARPPNAARRAACLHRLRSGWLPPVPCLRPWLDEPNPGAAAPNQLLDATGGEKEHTAPAPPCSSGSRDDDLSFVRHPWSMGHVK